MRKRIDRLEQTLFGCQRKLERARDRRLRIQRLLEMGENDHPLFRGFIHNYRAEVTRYDTKIAGLTHTITGTAEAIKKEGKL